MRVLVTKMNLRSKYQKFNMNSKRPGPLTINNNQNK